MRVPIGKAMRILLVLAVAASALSSNAAPRRRKGNLPQQQPPAQGPRDPDKLDRLLCEAVGGPFARRNTCPRDSQNVDGQKLWLDERKLLCTQQDGEEYDFYVRLRAACQAVVLSTSEAEAIKRLKELEKFISAALADPESNVRYFFGKRVDEFYNRTEHRRLVPTEKGRKTTDGILEYLHGKADSIPARRMIEGWIISRERNYVAELAEEVAESGFTPGVMITDGFIKRSNGRCSRPLGRGRPWKALDCCFKMSDEVRKIRNAVSQRDAPPDAAKKTIKNSLAELDMQVRQYGAEQGRFIVRNLNDVEYLAELEVRLEVQGNYERLLSRLAESLVDPEQRKIVEARLAKQRKDIASFKKKFMKMNPEALDWLPTDPQKGRRR